MIQKTSHWSNGLTETVLQRIERHIVAFEARVVEQEARIASLAQTGTGECLTPAFDVLEVLKEVLALFLEDLKAEQTKDLWVATG
ncbi:hypothetical protein [Roseomonas harenae]|uniref:hypothetical protein n=1 Tax=Muricoccus harenae TaxID=2692566 RepID=UPI001331691B|nr:hypothetical protein [Roseomonas harenae]